MAATALYRSQEDSTTGETVGKTAVPPSHHRSSLSPDVQDAGKASQRQWAGTRGFVSGPQ